MVRVITIRDDVYSDLYKLKKSKGMSFSQIIEYLIKEKENKTRDVLSLAGSINKEDVDEKAEYLVKKGAEEWKRYV
ncbi:hypothetical protein JXB01_02235 [Candidatus Micrarchaeota archaeon]|nr:hypothetical protein [Candidatus Micrarchaeota archaeon]